jgi:signal peptidase I
VRRTGGALALTAILALIAAGVWFAAMSPYKLYVVHTGSMVPAEPVKSLEIVHSGQYHVGQVVTYRYRGGTITHRLIGINSDGEITTKGDANRSADPWHPPRSSIVGGVVATVPEAGWWLVFLRQPTTLGILVCFILVFWMLSEPGITLAPVPRPGITLAKVTVAEPSDRGS